MVLKKVTAKEWKDMGLPTEINIIHFGGSKVNQYFKKKREETDYVKNSKYRIDPVTGKQVPK